MPCSHLLFSAPLKARDSQPSFPSSSLPVDTHAATCFFSADWGVAQEGLLSPPTTFFERAALLKRGWLSQLSPLLRSQDMAFGSIPPLQTAAATFLPKARESLRESYCERQWGVLFSLHMTPVCLFLVYYCKTLELDSRIEV